MLSSIIHVKRRKEEDMSRPSSPPDSLNLGETLKFNDKYWVVNQSDGVKYWDIHPTYKYNADYNKYFIHDNGCRPFSVYVKKNSKTIDEENKIFDTLDDCIGSNCNVDLLKIISGYAAMNTIHIYKLNKQIYNPGIRNNFQHGTHVKTYINVMKVFIGKSYRYSYDRDNLGRLYNKTVIRDQKGDPMFSNYGNSILLQLPDRYVFIGEYIYEFVPNDSILEYYSVIGKNDVPHPVAVGTNYVYMMLNKRYVNKKDFGSDVNWMDAYEEFYDKKYNSKPFKKRKLIHKRL